MFGRKQHDVEVRDPRSALAPFEVGMTDRRWVAVPSHFPTPQDKTVWDWTRRLAADYSPTGRTPRNPAPFGLMSVDINGRCAGHDAYWALLSEDPLPNANYLMLWCDLTDGRSQSPTDLQAALTADRYDGWGQPPLGYVAVPAGLPAVVAVDAARLGAGTCVIRRDLSELRVTDKHGHADDLFVKPGEDVRFWSFGMSLHWVFSGTGDLGTVLHAGVGAGGVGDVVELEALQRALPRFWELLDSIGRPGTRPRGIDTTARSDVGDVVSEMIAERRAEEERLVHHHLWNRR